LGLYVDWNKGTVVKKSDIKDAEIRALVLFSRTVVKKAGLEDRRPGLCRVVDGHLTAAFF
jgi:hypothetical protein